MQRAKPLAMADRLVRILRLTARAAFIDRYKRIELRIPSLDLY